MKVRIEIDTKTFVRFWLVVMGFGLAGLAIYSAKDALVLLGISLFLALALNRPVAAIAKKLPGKSRLGGTALAYTTLVLLLGCVIWFVIPPIVQQSAKFVESVPSIIDQASSQWRGVNDFIDKNNLRPQVDSMMENIKQQSSSWATSVGTNLLSSVGSLASFLGSLFLVLVLSFLMLLEGPTWVKRLWGLYNDEEKMERHKKLVGRMYNVVTGYVSGQLTVSGIDAILSGFRGVCAEFDIPCHKFQFGNAHRYGNVCVDANSDVWRNDCWRVDITTTILQQYDSWRYLRDLFRDLPTD